MCNGKAMKELEKEPDFYYSWQCLTLSRAKSTVDFVVKNPEDLMALLHVSHYLTQHKKHDLTNLQT